MTAKAKPRARGKANGGTVPVARRLTQLELGEVSCVDVPANSGARHIMFKNLASIAKSDGDQPQGSDQQPPQGSDQGGQGSDSTAKGAAEETTAALTARCADLQRRLAERDQELAWMADELARRAAAAEGDETAKGGQQQETDMTQQQTGGAPDGGTADKAAVDKAAAAQAAMIAKAVQEAVDKATADLTKRAEAAEKRAQDAENVANAEKAARELVDLTKAAEGPDFCNLPGAVIDKARALGAIAGLPEKERATLEAALKAGNAAMGRRFQEVGKGGDYGAGNVPDGMTPAEARLDTLAKDLAKAKGMSFAKAYSETLSANPDIYAQFRAEQRDRARGAA